MLPLAPPSSLVKVQKISIHLHTWTKVIFSSQTATYIFRIHFCIIVDEYSPEFQKVLRFICWSKYYDSMLAIQASAGKTYCSACFTVTYSIALHGLVRLLCYKGKISLAIISDFDILFENGFILTAKANCPLTPELTPEACWALLTLAVAWKGSMNKLNLLFSNTDMIFKNDETVLICPC